MNSMTELSKEATTDPMVPVLASYTDFRQYLKDFYDYKRKQTQDSIRPYNYATFAAAADIKSPNYLKLIIEGQRNLSDVMAKKFSKALSLSKEETEEFVALVRYGQSEDPIDRNRNLKALADHRVRQQMKSGEIKEETWAKVPSWVTWVLYALVDQKGAQFNVDQLFQLLKGKVRPEEIRRCLGRLIQSGELTMDLDTGEIRKGRELMAGSESVPPELVRKLQAELIYLGLESLFQEDPQDREVGAMTVALTEEEYGQLKFELRQLRKRWQKDVAVKRHTNKGDRVFQLNVQLFPLTKKS